MGKLQEIILVVVCMILVATLGMFMSWIQQDQEKITYFEHIAKNHLAHHQDRPNCDICSYAYAVTPVVIKNEPWKK